VLLEFILPEMPTTLILLAMLANRSENYHGYAVIEDRKLLEAIKAEGGGWRSK
jgi:hypothetical protein